MSDAEPSIEELIERSSLGTPEAKAIRDSADPEVVRRILMRAKEAEIEQLRAERDALKATEERVRALADEAQNRNRPHFMFGGQPFPAQVSVADLLAALDAPQRPEDLGVPVAGNPVARAHRSCPEHGDLETVAWELDAALRAEGEKVDALQAELAVVKRNWLALSETITQLRKEVAGRKEHGERLSAELAATKVAFERAWDLHREICPEAENERLVAERDALQAAIERVRADCEAQKPGDNSDADRKTWELGVYAQAKRVLNILAALDAPTAEETNDEA